MVLEQSLYGEVDEETCFVAYLGNRVQEVGAGADTEACVFDFCVLDLVGDLGALLPLQVLDVADNCYQGC